jgi:cell division protein ZapA (FtsZ GTPase activity inhibitor)
MKTNLKESVSTLLTEHGIKEVLQAIAEDVSRRESVIREENDRNLSNAVEFMFPLLVQAIPKVGGIFGSFIRRTLKSIPVTESLKVIKADSCKQSQAVKEAYQQWRDL